MKGKDSNPSDEERLKELSENSLVFTMVWHFLI